MEWSTHMLSGIAAGYAVTGGDWKGALVGGVAGVIPDLDEPKSKFGKIFLPISYPLNSIFGHRTFTHSLLFVLIAGGVLFPFTATWIWLSVVGGILAHIAGDMLTGKVQLLYPRKKTVGIAIPFFMFKLIDRITAAILLLIIGWVTVTKYVL